METLREKIKGRVFIICLNDEGFLLMRKCKEIYCLPSMDINVDSPYKNIIDQAIFQFQKEDKLEFNFKNLLKVEFYEKDNLYHCNVLYSTTLSSTIEADNEEFRYLPITDVKDFIGKSWLALISEIKVSGEKGIPLNVFEQEGNPLTLIKGR